MESAQWTNNAPGAIKTGEGAPPEKVIPASRRPDGTMRKEIRVRAGYVNQDEMARYESRGAQWKKDMPKLPPGMTEEDDQKGKAAAMSKSAKKNAKRKEKKEEGGGVEGVGKKLEATSLGPSPAAAPLPSAGENPKCSDEGKLDIEKKIRNLRKKVRQCEDLQARQAKGEKLEPEQERKIETLKSLQEEIEHLEKEASSK